MAQAARPSAHAPLMSAVTPGQGSADALLEKKAMTAQVLVNLDSGA